jgi:hypothetical protein
MMGVAFWITPEHLVLPVPTSHVEMVIDHHHMFGVSLEYVRRVYARHQEPLRSEGGAREEIIRELVIQKGFIRLRRYREKQAEYWSVIARQANETTLETIGEFFRVLMQGQFGFHEKDPFIEIRLDTINGRKDIVLKDLIEGYRSDEPQLTLWRPEREGS